MRDLRPPLFMLISAALALASCSPVVQPVSQSQTAPTPIVSVQTEVIEDPDVYVDPGEFKAALLQALMDQDTAKLQRWMTEPFLIGGWRADGYDTAPADALRDLYTNELGADNRLELVEDADLKALMGEQDPLAFPRSEAGVIEAALVSGWGQDGRDEAVLFIARAADNSLKWHGWIVFNGGLSGARLGGSQLYTNEDYAYRVYLPPWAEIEIASPDHVMILGPGEGHPSESRAAAFLDVEPANGRTVNEIVEQVKADVGTIVEIGPGTAMGLDKTMAIVLDGMPGQDSNRQLFMVYNDLLYHFTFIPDVRQAGTAYWEMEDMYAMIINTFHFTQ